MTAPLAEQSVRMPLNQLIDHFNNGITDAENFCFLARSSSLQLEQCLALDLLLYNATLNKHEAVRRGEEDHANWPSPVLPDTSAKLT